MTTHYMQRFFEPESIAVIGASERSPSLGGTVLRNLLDAGFPGTLIAVNRHGEETIFGVPRYKDVADLAEPPDLAVICTAPATIPGLIDELGKKGVHAVLIVMGGLSTPVTEERDGLGKAIDYVHKLLDLRLDSGMTLKEATWEAARPYEMRIMGPNCVGVVVPRNKLNASYAHCMVPKGDVAFVGQSGTLTLAAMDWSLGRGLGFSHVTSLGDCVDIDIADVVEYLAEDWRTRAILLQVEHLDEGGRFISALRAAARSKLVLVMKSRRVPESQKPPEPVAPGLADGDVVYDAALRRAGVLRVERLDEVLNALETLTLMRRVQGDRLAVLCNGIGPGIVASDHLVLAGGRLAELSTETLSALGELMPTFWSAGNPVDIYVTAPPELFVKGLEILRKDKDVDAVLVLHAPTILAPSLETAEAVIPLASKAGKPVLTSWMGHGTVQEARAAFDAAGVSTFDTVEQAVDAFMHMATYRYNQDQLSQIPPSPRPEDPLCDSGTAWRVVGDALNAGRTLLTDQECDRVLEAAGVPLADRRYAIDIPALRQEAAELEPPYGIKILHESVCRPFADSGPRPMMWRGIALDLSSLQEVEQAAHALTERMHRRFPDEEMRGFGVQRMRRGLNSLQLSMGITRDSVFGPLLFVGSGGNPTTALADRRVGLPPLNMNLARMHIESTDAGRALADFSADVERDLDALAWMLVRLGQLVVDVPVIAALEINPLLVNRDGVLAVEAKIALGDSLETAITPYPVELEETVTLQRSGRTVLLRPIRGEDGPAHVAFASRLSPEAIRFRFFQPRTNFTRQDLAQATQIDYAREMAFIATAEDEEGAAETLGVVRAWTEPDNVSAEFAIIVDDTMRGEGLGRLLLGKMIDYARQRGILELKGTVLPDNRPMQRLAQKMGFSSRFDREERAVVVSLRLNEPTDDWQRERLEPR